MAEPRYYFYYHQNIRPYLYEKQKKDYTTLIFMIVTLIVFGIYGLKPAALEVAEKLGKIKSGREAEKVLAEKIVNLQQAEKNYESLKEQIQKIDKSIPDNKDQPSIIENLALAAGKAGMELAGTSFEKEEEENSIKVMSISIFVKGTYDGMILFSKNLEELERKITIEEANMTFRERTEDLGITVKIKAYYIK